MPLPQHLLRRSPQLEAVSPAPRPRPLQARRRTPPPRAPGGQRAGKPTPPHRVETPLAEAPVGVHRSSNRWTATASKCPLQPARGCRHGLPSRSASGLPSRLAMRAPRLPPRVAELTFSVNFGRNLPSSPPCQNKPCPHLASTLQRAADHCSRASGKPRAQQGHLQLCTAEVLHCDERLRPTRLCEEGPLTTAAASGIGSQCCVPSAGGAGWWASRTAPCRRGSPARWRRSRGASSGRWRR
mmetsp:Transcript_16253/g.44138  ORF Transcript_16253/g.44138 Transcript_16253/m.44138 type:complete len:241 (-) Transcript_16253:1383-2105(-)